jgi:hypothetical protein
MKHQKEIDDTLELKKIANSLGIPTEDDEEIEEKEIDVFEQSVFPSRSSRSAVSQTLSWMGCNYHD